MTSNALIANELRDGLTYRMMACAHAYWETISYNYMHHSLFFITIYKLQVLPLPHVK